MTTPRRRATRSAVPLSAAWAALAVGAALAAASGAAGESAQTRPSSDAAQPAAATDGAPKGPGAADDAARAATLAAKAETARTRAAEARRVAAERAARIRRQEAALGQLGVSIVERERRLREARETLGQRLRFVAAAEVRLAVSRKRAARLAAAVQRAAREPTPSILAHPDRPLAAARSAMLMRRLGDALRRERAQELQDAAVRRDAVAAARRTETAILSDLEAARTEEAEISRLRDALSRERADALAEAEAAAADAARLAEEAGSLRALAAAALAAREEAARRTGGRERAERAALDLALARTEPPAAQAERAEPEAAERRRAGDPGYYRGLAGSSRLAPPAPGTELSFAKAQGRLYWPAAGDLRRPRGKNPRRVSLATDAHARVIAPWSGEVVFAGVFQGQGVVMIEPQKNYSILLAGLETLDVSTGQRVVAGEPLGAMGLTGRDAGPQSAGAPSGAGLQAKRLDIEITKDRKLLDPTPWFRPAMERISGL